MLELMVVVAIIAVLAAVAVPSLFGDSRRAKGDSEVNAFFGELSVREEQYKTEHGTYLQTGTGETNTFPATPTAKAQALGTLPTSWTQLRVSPPESSVRCGYVVIAGDATTGTVGSVASTSFAYVNPSKSWYYVLAHCDLDGSGSKDSYYFMSSDDSKISSINRGS